MKRTLENGATMEVTHIDTINNFVVIVTKNSDETETISTETVHIHNLYSIVEFHRSDIEDVIWTCKELEI